MALHEKYKIAHVYNLSRQQLFVGIGMTLLSLGCIALLSSGWLYTQLATATPQSVYLPSGEERGEYHEQLSVKQTHNSLQINAIGVDGTILEGGYEALAEGIWRIPGSSTPDAGSNTVLSAHRWMYGKDHPSSFFDLDELGVGDRIVIEWNGKKYQYEVYEQFDVTPDRVDILAPTDESIVTLFTCTPLYSTSHRLVVRGRLVVAE